MTTLAETALSRDRETRITVSHVVPVKGGDQEWVAEQLTRDILKLGLHDAEVRPRACNR